MALALDGSAHNNSGGASSLGASLTTTNTNDIIIAVATVNGGPVTSVSGGGLTWAKKASGTSDGGSSQFLELWYAVAAGTLSGTTITVNQTSSSYITIDVFAISGADTATIWDGAAVTGSGAGCDPLSISTTNANAFIIGAYRENSASNPTEGAGFTKISGADFQLAEYKVVSSTQSGLSVTQGTGAGTANAGIAVAVIQAAGAAPPPYNPWPQRAPILAQ